MDINQVLPHLLFEFSSEQELVDAIKEISHRFTLNREEIDRYTKDPKYVSAYTLFYGLTNIPKWQAVKEKIGFQLKGEVFDIGSGPATFSFAVLQEDPAAKVYLLESSELMREQGEKLLQVFFPEGRFQFLNNSKSAPDKMDNRIGIFGHSANEMSVNQVLQYIKDLALDEVLFIEPGTSEFFKKMLSIREQLIEKEGFQIHYPCPSQQACPMGEVDWCHQFIQVRHSDSVERLCQLVRKDRRLLPLTIHYYAKSQARDFEDFRVVRSKKPLKYAQPLVVCSENNNLEEVEVLLKGHAKSEIKELKKVLSGDIIKLSRKGTEKRVTWISKTKES